MAAKPIRLVDPLIKLGGPTTPPAVDLKCYCKGIHIMGEEDDALVTFCDPLGYAWKLSLDLLQSVGDEGLDTLLEGLGGPGTKVPFEFAYVDAPASTDNPHWTGEVKLVAYPIVDAQVNEPTEFTMEMEIIGDITKTVTAGP